MPDDRAAADARPHDDACRRRRWAYGVLAWVVLMGVAMLLDERAAHFGLWLADRIHEPVKFTTWAQVAKVPGEFYFTLAVAAVVLLAHPWKWRAGGLLCLSAMVGGALYTVLKWGVGRHRPVSSYGAFELVPFAGGWKGLFVAEPNLSFPSGHATCAFATAAALAVLYPRWRWAFYAVAAVTGVERVVERAHYLSDVVAAAGVGILSVHIAIYLATRVIDRKRPEGFPVVIHDDLVQAEPARKSPEPQ